MHIYHLLLGLCDVFQTTYIGGEKTSADPTLVPAFCFHFTCVGYGSARWLSHSQPFPRSVKCNILALTPPRCEQWMIKTGGVKCHLESGRRLDYVHTDSRVLRSQCERQRSFLHAEPANVGLPNRCNFTLLVVTTWMGDCGRVYVPSW